jgi:hypothetical protein
MQNKINELKSKLVTLKNEYRIIREDAEKAFDDVIIALEHDYSYRTIVEKQIDNCKNINKVVEQISTTDDKYQSINMTAIKEKYNLYDTLKTYNKLRNVNSYKIAEEKALLESEAKEKVLTCQSDLMGALMEFNGDKSDKLIDEASLLV